MTDEELVRKVWERLIMSGTDWPNYGKPGIAAWSIGRIGGGTTWDEAFSVAASYTRAHLEKVRQKREEINCVRLWTSFAGGEEEREIGLRILSMLEAQLAELENGLTDWAKEHVEELLKEH